MLIDIIFDGQTPEWVEKRNREVAARKRTNKMIEILKAIPITDEDRAYNLPF